MTGPEVGLLRRPSPRPRLMDASVGVWWPELGSASSQAGLLSMLVPALYLQPLVTADHGHAGTWRSSGAFRRMIDQLVGRLEDGAATGLVPLARHVGQSLAQLDRVLAKQPEEDPIATQAAPTELDRAYCRAAGVTIWSTPIREPCASRPGSLSPGRCATSPCPCRT